MLPQKFTQGSGAKVEFVERMTRDLKEQEAFIRKRRQKRNSQQHGAQKNCVMYLYSQLSTL